MCILGKLISKFEISLLRKNFKDFKNACFILKNFFFSRAEKSCDFFNYM